MIIWKGWGILALIIPLLFSWIANFIFDFMFGVDYYQNNEWAIPLILGLSSIPIWFIGYNLNNKPLKVLVDPETNENIEIKNIHSMFWVPLQYWAIVIFCISALLYASNIGLLNN